MKNIEVIQTLRFYDSDLVAKLSALLELEKENYRSKNEFLTAMLKRGYESHTTAANKSGGGSIEAADSGKDVYALLSEMYEYMALQFKLIMLYQEVYQKLLSSVYRMQLSLAGGEKVTQGSVEAGFYDDLPARFDKLIANIKKQVGLA